MLTCVFCLLCHSRDKHNSNIKQIPLCQSWWKWAFGNIEGGILNTPVTPQRVMDGIFSGWLQGPHFHAGVWGPRGSLGGRVVWVGAWGDTVIQTVSFVNFRLISWFWNSKGKRITTLRTRMDTKEAWKADSTWINVRSTHLRVLYRLQHVIMYKWWLIMHMHRSQFHIGFTMLPFLSFPSRTSLGGYRGVSANEGWSSPILISLAGWTKESWEI